MNQDFIEVTEVGAQAVAYALLRQFSRRLPGPRVEAVENKSPITLPAQGRDFITVRFDTEVPVKAHLDVSFLSIEGRHWLCGVAQLDEALGFKGMAAQVVAGVKHQVESEARRVLQPLRHEPEGPRQMKFDRLPPEGG